MKKPLTLQQFLKLKDIVFSGGEAKLFIQDGKVKVNGEIEKRRGRKIQIGDVIEVEGKVYKVENDY